MYEKFQTTIILMELNTMQCPPQVIQTKDEEYLTA